jgi:hypothetical protein
MRSTIAEALRDMRRLHDVDAGRLRGEIVYLSGHSADDPVPAAQPWADNLAGLIAAGRDGTVTAGTPRYLVYSDNVVVAWLTVHAEVVAPYSPILTANQIKHQGQAAAVLAHLDRTTLFDLADERDRREGRHNPDADATDGSARRGALRAAAVGDPTRTTWVHVDADPAVTRTRIHDALGVDRGQEVFVIAAWGYGEHCYRADRVSLELVCAVHAVAADHGVTEATVGNWIADPHGLDGRPDLATLAAASGTPTSAGTPTAPATPAAALMNSVSARPSTSWASVPISTTRRTSGTCSDTRPSLSTPVSHAAISARSVVPAASRCSAPGRQLTPHRQRIRPDDKRPVYQRCLPASGSIGTGPHPRPRSGTYISSPQLHRVCMWPPTGQQQSVTPYRAGGSSWPRRHRGARPPSRALSTHARARRYT